MNNKRIVFIAHRYHTNEFSLSKKLIENGFGISFLVFESNYSENHTIIKPIIMGYSNLLRFKGNQKRLKYGIPPINCFKTIKDINPDIVFIKGFSLSSLFLSFVLRCLKYIVVIYGQRPLYDKKYSLCKRAIWRLFGKKVITPVLGNTSLTNKNDVMFGQEWTYLPFVAEVNQLAYKRKYFAEDKVNILVVAKYTKRKKILEFIDVFNEIRKQNGKIGLTITGTILDELVYEEVIKKTKGIEEIKVLKDIPHVLMQELYMSHDLFVLPSINELASYSQLEAMSNGLAVVCSDDNGTAHYIQHGINGFVFSSKHFANDLYNKMNTILSDREILICMGQESINLIVKNHGIGQYIKYINEQF